MKVLLDTHTFIWWVDDLTQLSATALATIQDPANDVLLSVVSVWEVVIKTQLGKLQPRDPIDRMVAQQQKNRLQVLPVSLDHVLAVGLLPMAHKDPFDRLLIAQSNVEQAPLVTADRAFAQYPVQVIW